MENRQRKGRLFFLGGPHEQRDQHSGDGGYTDEPEDFAEVSLLMRDRKSVV